LAFEKNYSNYNLIMKKLIIYCLFLLPVIGFSQRTVSGQLTDDGEPLIGASIVVPGTTSGTITDLDGFFSLTVPEGYSNIEVSYVGYQGQTLDITGRDDYLGVIQMESGMVGLEEVVITGVMDIVQDRRTPVAVSTITTAEIQAKGGNVEFPELMKSTPSIYVAGQSGGYGDSEVFTRGFDQTNTAFLLNGQPINGMEDGKMYWSNWSGMTDVATAVQVQRGLGSSKLAISSVGGTTNIIMKSTELCKGGSVSFLRGNDNYNKFTASYNTGLINDKFGVTMLLTHWQGDGWSDGTKGAGQNYFISAGFKPSETHNFNFLLTGAPQWHHQRFNQRISDHERSGEFNIRHNGNWGLLDGEEFSSRRNYYHKPVANLNWEWALNSTSSLSTVLYGSWGRGGGSGGIGNRDNRIFTSDGLWDFEAIVAANRASAGEKEYVLRNSVNNHSWYGMVSKYETRINTDLTWSLGADLRTYHGSHFREVRDLLGAPAYTQRANARFPERQVTAEFKANPWAGLTSFADASEQIAYSNDETISYAGVFSQIEYLSDGFSGYVQGALSNQSHIRFELFNETESNEDSDKVNNLGYNLKTGFSIGVGPNSSLFFNTGYYKRQPFHDNIYLNFSNFVNPVTVSEKIFGLEAGYKYSSRDFIANINVYRTSWKDRTRTSRLDEGEELPNGSLVVNEAFRNSIQDQLHTGLELDFSYDVNNAFRIKGFGSVGDWAFDGTIDSEFYDANRNLILEDRGADVDGVKVGGSAQSSFGLGADYKISNDLRLDVDYNYYANLYSNISATNNALKLPSFGLMDLGLSYNINMSNGNLLRLRANIYNALGKEYISRATSAFPASSNESENWNGVNKDNFVNFGKTRTWNISAKYNFGGDCSGSSNRMASKPVKSGIDRKLDTDGDGIKDHKDMCPDIAGIKKFKGCPMSEADMAAKAAAEALALEEARIAEEKAKAAQIEADRIAAQKAAAERKRIAAEREAKRIADEKAAEEAAEAAKLAAEKEAMLKAEAAKEALKVRNAEVSKRFAASLQGIKFNSSQSTFKNESYARMDEAVAVLNEYGDIRILIQGHTDSQGQADANQILSQKRADAVKDYLVSKGINMSRISTNGLGEEYPIADNNTSAGRAQNRRVEFIIRNN